MDRDLSQTQMVEAHLARLRDGEPQAINDLLTQTGERLLHLTRKMLVGFVTVRRHEQTGDVLQNALLRLTRALQEAAPEDARHYFRLAALQIRRELLDLARRYSGKGMQSIDAGQSDDSALTPDLSPVEQTNDPRRMAEWTEFHRLIADLPEKEREVVDLLLYNGLSQQEAAEIMQVDVRSVKRYWQKARLLLYERMQQGATSPVALLMN